MGYNGLVTPLDGVVLKGIGKRLFALLWPLFGPDPALIWLGSGPYLPTSGPYLARIRPLFGPVPALILVRIRPLFWIGSHV